MKVSDHFKTIKKVVVGGGFIGAIIQTLSTNVLVQVINVLTGVITARTLAPHGRGDLATMLMWPGFFAGLTTFGMQASLIYQIRHGAERLGEFIGAALLIGTLSGSVAAVIGIIALPYWLHGYSPQVLNFAQWAMLTTPIGLIGGLLYTSAQAVQAFGRYNKFRILPSAITLTSLVILASLHLLTPRTAALTYLLAGIPITVWNAVWTFRQFDIRFDNVFECGKILLSYGIRVWGMDLIGSVADQMDRVLVVGFLTPRDMGLYVVALSSARLFSIVPGALQMVMAPKIVMLGPERGAPLLVRTARIILILMCAGAIPLGIFAPVAIKLVYGQKFISATPVFRVLLADAVISGFTWFLAQGFSTLGKPGRATIQQIVGLSASVPLLLVLVPRFGIDGACYAILTSTILRSIFAITSYRLLFGESLSHFIPHLDDIGWILSQLKAPRAAPRAVENI